MPWCCNSSTLQAELKAAMGPAGGCSSFSPSYTQGSQHPAEATNSPEAVTFSFETILEVSWS